MTRRVKKPKKCKKTQNVMLENVYWFSKQLTIASVAALLYAMTFVTFVALCVPLALCCDQSSRVVNLTYSLSKSVVITFGSAVIDHLCQVYNTAIPINVVVPLFH